MLPGKSYNVDDIIAMALRRKWWVIVPFVLGSLAASARAGRGGVVLNVSSDAAINAYAGLGAYGAIKAALHHMSRIWNEELAAAHIQVLSLDPGDMDTPLHAVAVPDADPGTLKQPEVAARELADALAAALPRHVELHT